MARIDPVLDLVPGGGQVVVTRFECRTLPALIAIRFIHTKLQRDVRRSASGFLGVRTIINWRTRTMLSLSVWQSLDDIYSMGNVPRHVAASRLPAHLGVATSCGIFYLVGDWRRVMFGGDVATRSPLHPLAAGPQPSSPAERIS